MTFGGPAAPLIGRFNRAMAALATSPRWSRFVQRSTAVIHYTGRRSGKQFTTPIAYKRTGPQDIVIRVVAPDAKTWWRNFTGEGGPITVQIGTRHHPGHAVTTRTDNGKVTVAVHFDAP